MSPQKKRLPAMDSVRRASGTVTAEDSASAAARLGIASKSQQKPQGSTTSSRSTGMLPTPTRTPRKQPNEQAAGGVNAVARNLFPSEDMAASTPKKKAKKYSGLMLDSFMAEDAEEAIPIFTDSRDRIPEVDASADNPFYGVASQAVAQQPEPAKRRSRRGKHVTIPGEGKHTVEDAVKRDDGMVYVL